MISILIEAAKKSGEIIRKYYKKNIPIFYKKSHQDLVTEADRRSQEIICQTITRSLKRLNILDKEIGFISEENIYKPAKHLFIIDPLDGTTNFAAGIDYFGISLAYIKDRRLILSVVYDPIQSILYVAEKGRGSVKISNNRRSKLQVSYSSLKESILATHFSISSEEYRKKIANLILKIFTDVRQVRINGCAVLDYCHLTENIHQIYLNPTNRIWDIAAAKLIVEEGGGCFTDWEGKEVKFEYQNPAKHYTTLACYPRHLSKIISYLK